MPVNDDLCRASQAALDWFAAPGGDPDSSVIADALRAALAARSRPLFEGTIIDNGESASTPIVLIQMRHRRPLLDLDEWTGDEVVVYPASAGSVAPTGDNDE